MDDITVRFIDRTPGDGISAPVLIEGLPGIGHVGKLVAEHLVRELGAEKIAEIASIFFPPQVIIDEQGTVRLANNEVYYYEGETHRLLFLVGDFQATSAEGHYLLADAYLDIAEACGVQRLYTLGGYGVGHLVEEPRVLGAVNQSSLRESVEAAGAIVSRDEPGARSSEVVTPVVTQTAIGIRFVYSLKATAGFHEGRAVLGAGPDSSSVPDKAPYKL